MKPSVIYISYDGLLEPLGQSQVLAYLERLASTHDIHLISFEKRHDRQDSARMAAMRERTEKSAIRWHPLAYHKRPTAPATAFDIMIGTFVALWLVLRHRASIVHVRSYVPAAMGYVVTRLTGARFLFDIRGFWADERVDGGLWRRDSTLYRVTKWLERKFFQSADQIVALTEASKREIESFSYMKGRAPAIEVIPTCTDLARFRAQGAKPAEPFTLGYVGSVGTWYLLDEVLRCFRILRERKPNARLLIVNRNEHELIRSALERFEIDPAAVDLVAAEHHEVPALVSQMHAGTAFVKPAYSKLATAPTKLAEYLGCGVPCLGDAAAGDMRDIVETNRVGVIVGEFTDGARREAVDRLLSLVADTETSQRCVATAQKYFSLDTGVARYRAIYRRLAHPRKAQAPGLVELAEE